MEFTLKSGHTILFDEEDLHYLICVSWKVSNHGYLRSSVNGNPTSFHRLILGNLKGNVDHIDGNPLNNQKKNLRICDQIINGFNKKTKPHTSKYRGVSWCKSRNQWRATINRNKKHINIGYFINEEEAYAAYTRVAKHIYGFLPYELKEFK